MRSVIPLLFLASSTFVASTVNRATDNKNAMGEMYGYTILDQGSGVSFTLKKSISDVGEGYSATITKNEETIVECNGDNCGVLLEDFINKYPEGSYNKVKILQELAQRRDQTNDLRYVATVV